MRQFPFGTVWTLLQIERFPFPPQIIKHPALLPILYQILDKVLPFEAHAHEMLHTSIRIISLFILFVFHIATILDFVAKIERITRLLTKELANYCFSRVG